MSKFSFKNDEIQSSVVVLKDGSCLEVRRGAKTKWSPGEERGRWPNVEAWTATLPAGAIPVKSGNKRWPRKSYDELTDPILLKILSVVIFTISGKTYIRRPYVDGQLRNDDNGSFRIQQELGFMKRVAIGLEFGALIPDRSVSEEAVRARIGVLEKKYNDIIAGSPDPGWYIRGRAARTLNSSFYLDDGKGHMYSIFWHMGAQIVMVWIPTCGLVPIRDVGLTDDQILTSIWHAPISNGGGPSMYRL